MRTQGSSVSETLGNPRYWEEMSQSMHPEGRGVGADELNRDLSQGLGQESSLCPQIRVKKCTHTHPDFAHWFLKA